MSSLVTINDISLEQLLYHDTPVVTIAMVAKVHGVSENTVRNSFHRNKARFVEGKHFYSLTYQEVIQASLSVMPNPDGMTVFTEKGYLLLVKPMRDQKSWEVQEHMIDEYFALRAIAAQTVSALDAYPEMKAIVEMAHAVAEQRQQIAALQAANQAQQLQIIAIHEKTIATQNIALSALRNQQWMTIRQYVAVYDMSEKLSPSDQKAFADVLGKYCYDNGMPMYKAQTADTTWPNERTYHAGTIHEVLHSWLLRRHAQTSLKIVEKSKEDG